MGFDFGGGKVKTTWPVTFDSLVLGDYINVVLNWSRVFEIKALNNNIVSYHQKLIQDQIEWWS